MPIAMIINCAFFGGEIDVEITRGTRGRLPERFPTTVMIRLSILPRIYPRVIPSPGLVIANW
jgi:hypothetical protein